MTRVNWDSTSKRFFQAGIDQVMLYVGDEPGVPWPGVVSISESSAGGGAKAYYLDGYKYLNMSTSEEFVATIETIGHPYEFDACDGIRLMANGLLASQQPRIPFGLSYRTSIGSDLDPLGSNYLYHTVYNAMAEPSDWSNVTINDSAEVNSRTWDITTMGISYPGFAPIAHVIIDTRRVTDYTAENGQIFTKAHILENLENHLYGDYAYAPMLPTPDQMATVMEGQLLERIVT